MTQVCASVKAKQTTTSKNLDPGMTNQTHTQKHTVQPKQTVDKPPGGPSVSGFGCKLLHLPLVTPRGAPLYSGKTAELHSEFPDSESS